MSEHDALQAVVPAGWIAPLDTLFAEMLDLLADESVGDEQAVAWLELAVQGIPALIDEMDVDALAAVIEAGMGQAAVAGAAESLSRSGVQAYSSAAADRAIDKLDIAFGPLPEAVARLGKRTPIGARLSSAEWARVPRALRESAQFSAHVESARLLTAIQEKLRRRLDWESEAVANGQALVDRSSFIADLRQIAKEEGIQTAGPEAAGTVRDIRSAKRLGLIYDMQTRQAAEFARAKMDMDPDLLDEWPAYRFVRVESRSQPRGDWPARWDRAAAEVGFAGVARDAMVALKTSPVWAALSEFGNPWPPYDYGSGMGRVDVDRDAAEALGLIKPGEALRPLDLDVGNGLEASAESIDDYGLDHLQQVFGEAVKLVGNRIVWAGNAA
jgi:hypothetical protein